MVVQQREHPARIVADVEPVGAGGDGGAGELVRDLLEGAGRARDGDAPLGRPRQRVGIGEIERKWLEPCRIAELTTRGLGPPGVPSGQDEAGVGVGQELAGEVPSEDAVPARDQDARPADHADGPGD